MVLCAVEGWMATEMSREAGETYPNMRPESLQPIYSPPSLSLPLPLSHCLSLPLSLWDIKAKQLDIKSSPPHPCRGWCNFETKILQKWKLSMPLSPIWGGTGFQLTPRYPDGSKVTGCWRIQGKGKNNNDNNDNNNNFSLVRLTL